MTADQFVEAEVFEMSAVGEVQVAQVLPLALNEAGAHRPARAVVAGVQRVAGCHPEQFVEERRARQQVELALVGVAWVAHPETEPQVEGAHRERDGRPPGHRELAHLRVERRGRGGERRRESEVVLRGGDSAEGDSEGREDRASRPPVEAGQRVPGEVVRRAADKVDRTTGRSRPPARRLELLAKLPERRVKIFASEALFWPA